MMSLTIEEHARILLQDRAEFLRHKVPAEDLHQAISKSLALDLARVMAELEKRLQDDVFRSSEKES